MTINSTPTVNGPTPQIVYHNNIDQDFITISEDRLRLCLIENETLLVGKSEWLTPLGLVLSLAVTFASSTFKEWIFPASTWQAIFAISMLISFIWLIRSAFFAFKNRGRGNISEIVGKIKSKSNSSLN